MLLLEIANIHLICPPFQAVVVRPYQSVKSYRKVAWTYTYENATLYLAAFHADSQAMHKMMLKSGK